MDPRLEALSEQLLRYRELLALSYAQKDAIQKGDLSGFASLLGARQELIERIKQSEPDLQTGREEMSEDDLDTERRLMSEEAALLEKLVSLDKENERLLEVRMAASQYAMAGAMPRKTR